MGLGRIEAVQLLSCTDPDILPGMWRMGWLLFVNYAGVIKMAGKLVMVDIFNATKSYINKLL